MFQSCVIMKEVTASSLDICDYFTRIWPYEIIIVLCQLKIIHLICDLNYLDRGNVFSFQPTEKYPPTLLKT